ncbi:hypothetical protein F5Y19DRAFT_473573 [Xylariaceae sp. FL1651]|nr:hypothetical protein F5Y19DRAFT_473573 [Xylariaceae sp. FL1651]
MDPEPPTAKPSFILRMPAEIRNAIYEHAVTNEWGSMSQDFFVLDRPLPALFRTNRQIRSEALDLFLLKNHFHVYTSKIGNKWLGILGKDVNRFRFLSVFIDLDIRGWKKYIKALLSLVSIHLELRIRKAAASLLDAKFEKLLKDLGLYDENHWTSEQKSRLLIENLPFVEFEKLLSTISHNLSSSKIKSVQDSENFHHVQTEPHTRFPDRDSHYDL